MKTAVIACKIMQDELGYAMEKTGCDYPIVWLEQELHNVPAQLHDAVQQALDQQNAERVLLAMGFCSNAIQGVKVPVEELICPRVDDCISLLLGSVRRRGEIAREYAAYYFTEGWLRGERNIWVEHRHMLEEYGLELTAELEKDMYGNYRTLALLDCGIYPMEPLVEKTREIAEGLHLEQRVIPASVGYLEQLLTGPWPAEKFLTLHRGSAVTAEDLQLDV